MQSHTEDTGVAAGRVVVDVPGLERLAIDVIAVTGTPPEAAGLVGRSLVDANVVGHDSHGVMRLRRYVDSVNAGDVLPTAHAVFERRSAGTGHVDGAWGWGQVAAQLATSRAIELCREGGIAAVTIDRCNHIGRLGAYAEQIAAAGMVGIVLCNAEPVVAPFRGRVRALGTNPIALSSPRAGGGAPIVLDVATASVAEGKLALALSEGRMVDHGQIVDSVGRDSTDPRDFYAGGALLPFGGHKGYGISVFVEILGGILSGAGAASAMKYVRGNGAHVIAIDVRTFLPLSQFEGEIEELADNLAGAGGVDDPVLLPGQLEGDSRARRTAEGIELPVETWRDLCELTARLGIDMTQLPPLPDLDGRRLTPQENA